MKNGLMMSACTCRNSGTRMCSMLASEPVSKLSTQITRWPRRSNSSHRCDPRKPAPPVTRQVAMTRRRITPLAGAGGLERLLADVRREDVEAVVALGRQPGGRQSLAGDGAFLAPRPRLAAALLRLDDLSLGHVRAARLAA